MLKLLLKLLNHQSRGQPPSGGCVLKQLNKRCLNLPAKAATFGWLCVETKYSESSMQMVRKQPPSGGCVLKQSNQNRLYIKAKAATFGWLCVETLLKVHCKV